MCYETLLEKCTEWRSRTETTADEFIPDASIFLEFVVAGKEDQNRSSKIERISKVVLAKYVDRM